jgi:hypothetical protein
MIKRYIYIIMYKHMNLCQSAQWSMGMIPALGAGCPTIISRLSRFLLKYSRNILNYNMKKNMFFISLHIVFLLHTHKWKYLVLMLRKEV